ncbi:uncharacterized protein LOC121139850 [Mesocricetus auratus]|uniref:Uncharacterized protein LOC121139850 n=1 Tax=Mesocricetus auratus TaxID=10036 RepID=A0ABM2XAG7_MESAU|nr:uncharacterized protein LOC121139850 [Mesocricetus auratus]
MAYINCQDWAVGDLCRRAASDGDLDLREEFLIVALLSLEWLLFVGILGFLTFQIILQTIWKNEEEDQEVADITILQKPPPYNEEQQNVYEEEDGFEFDFGEDFYEDLDFKEYSNEEDSEEEDDDDSGTSSVCSTIDRFLHDEVKYKLSYYFRHLGVLEPQSAVTGEPTAYEYETSDESFEGNADEEQWGEDESGNFEEEPYKDRVLPEWYFPEERSCKA